MDNKSQEIMKAFDFRYACKKFDASKKVSEENFETILEAGRMSPSSFGFEPWKFIVVQNQELREKLFPIAWGAQNALKGASHFVIILARRMEDMKYDSDYIKRIMTDVKKLPKEVAEGMGNAYKNFQLNDFNLMESDRAIFDWSCKQTYIALGNMLTVAGFLEIDSCPIEGFNREKVEELLEKENIIDTKEFGVSVMAGFGYRDETPFPKTRQDMKDIVQWI